MAPVDIWQEGSKVNTLTDKDTRHFSKIDGVRVEISPAGLSAVLTTPSSKAEKILGPGDSITFDTGEIAVVNPVKQ